MSRRNSRRLYKYVSIETALKIIIGKRLKFSNPAEFNDPFDSNIDRLEFNINDTGEDFLLSMQRQKEIARLEFGDKSDGLDWSSLYKKVQLRRLATSKICCFSLTNTHPLLWAHYGDKHHGACLVFNDTVRPRFTDDFDKFLKIDGPVRYQNFKLVNYCQNITEGLIHLFMVKGKDWRYEKEHRYILYDCYKDYFELAPGFLTGIIFGMKVSEEEILSFKNEIGDLGLNITFEKAYREHESLSIRKWTEVDDHPKTTTNVSIVSSDPKLQLQVKAILDDLRSERRSGNESKLN